MKHIKLFEGFLFEVEIPGGSNMEKVKTKFNVKSEDGVFFFHVKDKKDFPWRIKEVNNKFTLSQQFSPRVHIKPTWSKKGEFETMELAIEKIIKDYNKSAKNPSMGWKEIK